jgi:hypothetical protein
MLPADETALITEATTSPVSTPTPNPIEVDVCRLLLNDRIACGDSPSQLLSDWDNHDSVRGMHGDANVFGHEHRNIAALLAAWTSLWPVGAISAGMPQAETDTPSSGAIDTVEEVNAP